MWSEPSWCDSPLGSRHGKEAESITNLTVRMLHDPITPCGDAAAEVATENTAAEDATGALLRHMLKMINVGQLG